MKKVVVIKNLIITGFGILLSSIQAREVRNRMNRVTIVLVGFTIDCAQSILLFNVRIPSINTHKKKHIILFLQFGQSERDREIAKQLINELVRSHISII